MKIGASIHVPNSNTMPTQTTLIYTQYTYTDQHPQHEQQAPETIYQLAHTT